MLASMDSSCACGERGSIFTFEEEEVERVEEEGRKKAIKAQTSKEVEMVIMKKIVLKMMKERIR